MKPRLTLLLFFLIALPFGLIAWLGLKTARDDRELQRVRFDELLEARLAMLATSVKSLLNEHEAHLAAETRVDAPNPPSLREIRERERLVRQIFLLDTNGKLLFPKDDATSSREERIFLRRIGRILEGKETFSRSLDEKQSNPFGWYVWYFEEGVNLIFWQRLQNGDIIGVELSRIALLSDIVADMEEELPAGVDETGARIVLEDASGRAIFGFGGYTPGGEAPRVERSLDEPLGSLRLAVFVDPEVGLPGGGMMGFFFGLGALLLVILLATIYYLRETGRELREANRRVTFVNQVSHELKTPLTNIRMYAELLGMELEDGDDQSRAHVDIIVRESQRLSRLIGNVLTFGRGMRKQLAIHPVSMIPDEVTRKTLQQFAPSLRAKQIEIRTDLDAPERVSIDPDAVEQILGNLLGNVEKYAAKGKLVKVASRQTDGETSIIVEDRGGGIPKAVQHRVFEPFFRVSDAVTDGVGGTGIGLSIARDLARLHGGDIALSSGPEGARFEVTLKTPRATQRSTFSKARR